MSKTAAELRDVIAYYQALPEIREMHATIEQQQQLLTHQLMEHLPEHFTRGDLMPVRTGTLAHLLQNVLADTVALPMTVDVRPANDGRSPSEIDRIEMACSLARARLDEGHRVSSELRGIIMTASYAVMQLRCKPPGSPGFRWEVILPDPLTCYFPIKAGPLRPEIMARSWEMLVRDVQATYKGNREYRGGEKPYMKANGQWDWMQLSDDYPEDKSSIPGTGSSAMGVQKVRVFEVDYGDVICTSVCGLDGDTNKMEMVSETRNLTGGVRSVVLPHTVLPVRGSDRYQAGFWPAYQDMLALNTLRTMRASRSINAKPDVIIEMSPEQMQAVAALGDSAAGITYFDLASGTANIIRAPGRATLWEMLPDPGLDQQIEDVKQDLFGILQGYSEISEAAAKEINTNVYLPMLENRRRHLSPLLTASDWGWQMMLEMLLHSIPEYGETFNFEGKGGEYRGKYKEVEPGGSAKLEPSDIKKGGYLLTVATRAASESELRLRTQEDIWMESQGLKTRRQVIENRWPDATGQLEALAKDLAVKQTAPFYDSQLYPIFSDQLAEFGGAFVAPPVPAPMPSMPVAPRTGVSYNSPVVPGPAGANAGEPAP